MEAFFERAFYRMFRQHTVVPRKPWGCVSGPPVCASYSQTAKLLRPLCPHSQRVLVALGVSRPWSMLVPSPLSPAAVPLCRVSAALQALGCQGGEGTTLWGLVTLKAALPSFLASPAPISNLADFMKDDPRGVEVLAVAVASFCSRSSPGTAWRRFLQAGNTSNSSQGGEEHPEGGDSMVEEACSLCPGT